MVNVVDVLNPMAEMTWNELWILNGYGPTTKWNDDKIYGMLKYKIMLYSIGFDIINDIDQFS